MCATDKAWITELTLIHNNIRSVRNSHTQVNRSIECKTYHDVTDKKNNISSEGLAEILAIMYVLTFIIAVILYMEKI